MNGQPVWLASYSLRDSRGSIVATGDWTEQQHKEALRFIKLALRGVGDKSRERCFRMNVTLCLHRAATEEEVQNLPSTWQSDLSGIAGGPVEVLWSKGVTESDSAQPCANPKHLVIDKSRPDLWVPQDCGFCKPCIARRKIVEDPNV